MPLQYAPTHRPASQWHTKKYNIRALYMCVFMYSLESSVSCVGVRRIHQVEKLFDVRGKLRKFNQLPGRKPQKAPHFKKMLNFIFHFNEFLFLPVRADVDIDVVGCCCCVAAVGWCTHKLPYLVHTWPHII